jgi:hypothetical protein
LITGPSLSAGNPDSAAHTAGTTFVGQFIDHDITFALDSLYLDRTPAPARGHPPGAQYGAAHGARDS